MKKIEMFNRCFAFKYEKECYIISNVKPKYISNKNIYQITLKQNDKKENFTFDKNETTIIKYNNNTLYLSSISKLANYFNTNEPIYQYINTISFFESLKQINKEKKH